DQIESACFAGQHPSIANFADRKRPETMGIADTDQFLFGYDHERVSAFHLADRLHQSVDMAVELWLGHQMKNDLAIDGSLENGAAGLEFITQMGRIGDVAIMSDGDLAARAIDGERLRVDELG